MNRRTFVQSGVAATVATATATAAHAAAPARAKQPNVLYVFSDQHRALSLPGEAFNQAMAPNIDAFRHQNFSMDHCVSNYPLCTPYRAILMSGRWPYQTGMTHNGAILSPNEVTLGDTFSKAGYYTGYIGKWHLDGNSDGDEGGFIPKGPKRMGFADWHVWDSTNNHYHAWTYNPETGEKISPEGWQPIPMTDEAITFLKAQPRDRPWFLMLSWNPPHPPFNPPAEDTSPYSLPDLKLRPNVKFRPENHLTGPAHPLTSSDLLRKAMQGYYGGITGVDTEFARILKALDELGLTKDTIVIYTSDHGEMMGSQGRMSKQVPFEESCRVPFAVRYPGVSPKNAKSDFQFAAIDIYPTLCGLAGIPIPSHCQGRDFSPIMRGQKMQPSEAVFLMNQISRDDQDDEGAAPARRAANRKATDAGGELGIGNRTFVNQPSFRGLRTDTHTYAVADDGRWLLFDNIADPYQMKNLVRDPAQKALMEKFDGLIRAWLKKSSDPYPYAAALDKISSFPS